MNRKAVNLKRIDLLATSSQCHYCRDCTSSAAASILRSTLKSTICVVFVQRKKWQFSLRKINDTAVSKVETERWRRPRSDQSRVINLGSSSRAQDSRSGQRLPSRSLLLRLQDLKKLTEKNNEKIEIVIEAPNAIDFTASNSKASTDLGARAKN